MTQTGRPHQPRKKETTTIATGGRPRKAEFPGDRVVLSTRLDVGTFLREQEDTSAYMDQLVRDQSDFQRWFRTWTGPTWPAEKQQFLVSEAAAYLGVDPSTVRRWCKTGKIRYTILGEEGEKSRAFLIERAALDALRESRKGRPSG